MAEKSDPPLSDLPSYSESIASNVYSPGPSLNNIAAARTALIRELISTHVTLHLHSNALSGLSNTTLLIVPANVTSLQPPPSTTTKGYPGEDSIFPGETIVGFPSAENLTLIRLKGQENNLGFWYQPAVVSELEQQLCSDLRRQGYHVVGSKVDAEPRLPVLTKFGSIAPPGALSTEWRTVAKTTLAPGEVSVDVRTQDICLRIENQMGLYETRTGKAVVIKVGIGG